MTLTNIAIAGYAQSGKSTAASCLEILGWKRAAFADGLRSCASAIDPIVGITQSPDPVPVRYNEIVGEYGYEAAKLEFPEVRRFLQALGTEAGRQVIDPDVWVKLTIRNVSGGGFVLDDCRFHNEANAIRSAGGIVIRIVRPGVGPVNNHPSEIDLDMYSFDAVITNDGSVEDLYWELRSALDI